MSIVIRLMKIRLFDPPFFSTTGGIVWLFGREFFDKWGEVGVMCWICWNLRPAAAWLAGFAAEILELGED